MALYEVKPDGLVAVAPTSFAAEGIRERGDIQRLLRESIDCLDPGLLVIAEEFGAWADSARRIDLLCVDTDARLVVVELKRSDDGGHMELQALRYAAMVSAMTFDQAVATLARHRGPGAPDLDAARAEILTFLGWSAPDEDSFASDTRVILAAADFGKELTTCVLWLRERGLDIRCVRLQPYRLDDGRLMVDIQPLIPLPEAAAFQTRIGEKQAAERREKMERHDLRVRFLLALQAAAGNRSLPHVGRRPQDVGVLNGAIGRAGFTINYVTNRSTSRVELLMQAGNAREQMRALIQHQKDVETAFGGPLVWEENENSRQCRVYWETRGGYRAPEVEWPALHEMLIGAMIRLDAAVRPLVPKLP
jgi:hypothetical protein